MDKVAKLFLVFGDGTHEVVYAKVPGTGSLMISINEAFRYGRLVLETVNEHDVTDSHTRFYNVNHLRGITILEVVDADS
jgi:hypothetical protein